MSGVLNLDGKELPPIVPGLSLALIQGLTPDLFLDSENVTSLGRRPRDPLARVKYPLAQDEKLVKIPDLSAVNFCDPHEARYCRMRTEGGIDELELDLRNAVSNYELIVVKGTSGVGKTTLVRYCIRKIRQESDLQSHQDTILWIDLKLISGFDKQVFYSILYERILEAFPAFFPFDKAIWQDHLDDIMSKERRFEMRKLNNQEAEQIEANLVHEAAQNRQSCVVQFVRYRRKTFPSSIILLVVDNIDTALVENDSVQISDEEGSNGKHAVYQISSGQRKLIQTVLSESVAANQELRKYLNATIISCRPETYRVFEADLQIQVPKREFNIPAVNPYYGIKGRIDYVKHCVEDWKLTSQHFHEVNIYGFKATDSHGHEAGKLVDGYKYPYQRFPSFYRPVPIGYPDSFLIFTARSYTRSLQDFSLIGKLVQSALDEEAIGDRKIGEAVDDNQFVRGARGEVAWAIFRKLCGNSMRKAIELSGVVLESPGLYHQAAAERGVRAYPFLDSLVDAAFHGSSSGIGANSEKYIGNVYQTEVGGHKSLLFLPALVSYLVKRYLNHGSSINPFKFDSLDKEELITDFKELGFSKLTVSEGLKRACRLGFLKPIVDDSGNLVGYNIDEAIVSAHDLLIYEAAYVDNVPYALKGNISLFSSFRKTVGYNPTDLADRIFSSQAFIDLLINSEIKFSESCTSLQHDKWRSLGVESVSLRTLYRYNERLKAISKNLPRSVSSRIADFRSHFNKLMQVETLDSLALTNIPLFPYDGKPL